MGDSNRLSQDDVKRMVDEAEKFKEQDDALKARVEAKNQLESYLFGVRNTMLSDEKMKTALGDDAEVVDKTSQEGLDWLDAEEDANRTKEDYEAKQKEIESVLMPLVQKAYQANMPQDGGQQQVPQQEPEVGPSVEEI